MHERPILFSAPMVSALLVGTKTQTRRVMKYQVDGPGRFEIARPGYAEIVNEHGVHIPGFFCPYGQPGDRLWVRESYRLCAEFDAQPPSAGNPANRVWYEADAPHQPGFGKGRPSIHMPRWASRITLEITGVHVERIQAISEADAIAEGVEPRIIGGGWREYGLDAETEAAGTHPMASARESFRSLWMSINGAESWDANPWVWTVAFKRIMP